jgi:uncharacterized membrane protein SirB2
LSSTLATPVSKRSQFFWGLFAWVGIPLLFATLVPVGALFMHVDPEGILLVDIVFVVIGTIAIAKGQRPKRTWIVVVYPLPMVCILMLIVVAMTLLSAGAG